MAELKIELPPEIAAEEAQLLLTLKLYEVGRLTMGQAARYSGLSPSRFEELKEKYTSPVASDVEEMRRQIVEGCRDMGELNLEIERKYHPLAEEMINRVASTLKVATGLFSV